MSYQEIKDCLQHLKYLESQKLFLYCFYYELYTQEKPPIIMQNPQYSVGYEYFKYQYLQQRACASTLINEQYYLADITVKRGLNYATI